MRLPFARKEAECRVGDCAWQASARTIVGLTIALNRHLTEKHYEPPHFYEFGRSDEKVVARRPDS